MRHGAARPSAPDNYVGDTQNLANYAHCSMAEAAVLAGVLQLLAFTVQALRTAKTNARALTPGFLRARSRCAAKGRS